MLPTPSTSHVCFDNVYEPAEDSYLLLDTLSSASEFKFLSERLLRSTPSPVVVEVGTGSGVVLAFVTAHATSIFGRRDILTLGTDVNSFACTATTKTVENAKREQLDTASPECAIFSDSIIADLTSPLRNNMVDILIFNPPYVPTEELPDFSNQEAYNAISTHSTNTFERDSHLLSLSYAGGVDGMETTNRLITQLPDILSRKRGIGYILLCAQNKPIEVKNHIRAWGAGWQAETVSHSGKQGGWEKLQILRIWQQDPSATQVL
jgi:release factor glutamine methyltransferase